MRTIIQTWKNNASSQVCFREVSIEKNEEIQIESKQASYLYLISSQALRTCRIAFLRNVVVLVYLTNGNIIFCNLSLTNINCGTTYHAYSVVHPLFLYHRDNKLNYLVIIMLSVLMHRQTERLKTQIFPWRERRRESNYENY